MRVKIEIPKWESLTADLILEASRARHVGNNSNKDSQKSIGAKSSQNPSTAKRRTVFAPKAGGSGRDKVCGYCLMSCHTIPDCWDNLQIPIIAFRTKRKQLSCLLLNPKRVLKVSKLISEIWLDKAQVQRALVLKEEFVSTVAHPVLSFATRTKLSLERTKMDPI